MTSGTPKKWRRTTATVYCCKETVAADQKSNEKRMHVVYRSTTPSALTAAQLMKTRFDAEEMEIAERAIRNIIDKAFAMIKNSPCESRRRCSSCLLDKVLCRHLPKPSALELTDYDILSSPKATQLIHFQQKLKRAKAIGRALEKKVQLMNFKQSGTCETGQHGFVEGFVQEGDVSSVNVKKVVKAAARETATVLTLDSKDTNGSAKKHHANPQPVSSSATHKDEVINCTPPKEAPIRKCRRLRRTSKRVKSNVHSGSTAAADRQLGRPSPEALQTGSDSQVPVGNSGKGTSMSGADVTHMARLRRKSLHMEGEEVMNSTSSSGFVPGLDQGLGLPLTSSTPLKHQSPDFELRPPPPELARLLQRPKNMSIKPLLPKRPKIDIPDATPTFPLILPLDETSSVEQRTTSGKASVLTKTVFMHGYRSLEAITANAKRSTDQRICQQAEQGTGRKQRGQQKRTASRVRPKSEPQKKRSNWVDGVKLHKKEMFAVVHKLPTVDHFDLSRLIPQHHTIVQCSQYKLALQKTCADRGRIKIEKFVIRQCQPPLHHT